MRYEAPTTVENAVALLAMDHDVRVLAGGTDLLVRMKTGFIEPDVIVDIKRIEGMMDIMAEDGGWRIGAGVPGAVVNEHAGVKGDWPGVVEALDLIGSTQIQGRATLSGNLCNAGPAGDSVPAMVAANATARVVGPDGVRDIPVLDVPVSPGKNSLAKGEFVSSIFLPKRGERGGDAYLRFIPRTEMDIAVVGCGVSLSLDEAGVIQSARVSLGAVGPKVMLVEKAADILIGSKLDDPTLDKLAKLCSDTATPIDDKRGTVNFRIHVSGVLARRAAKIAYTRAGGAS